MFKTYVFYVNYTIFELFVKVFKVIDMVYVVNVHNNPSISIKYLVHIRSLVDIVSCVK